MKLENKKTLIVGASSEIGMATARLFASEGAKITLVGRSRARLGALAEELGKRSHFIVRDVADVDSCITIVPASLEAMGTLDAVVYAAGIVEPCLLKNMSIESFIRHLDVNLTGNFIVAQAAALFMNGQDGEPIVNFSSELAHIGMEHYVHYCAAKAGVVGLTMALAAEVAPKVRVNAISPGPVETPMLNAELELFGNTTTV